MIQLLFFIIFGTRVATAGVVLHRHSMFEHHIVLFCLATDIGQFPAPEPGLTTEKSRNIGAISFESLRDNNRNTSNLKTRIKIGEAGNLNELEIVKSTLHYVCT
jgi:hypothetical protein